jgi:23S rRNA pseudouridine955/2504/2580 synthase
MSGISSIHVAGDEADLRLDRWFKRHYPGLSHVHLQKLLRKGDIRVDGKRAKANTRLQGGQKIRIPPLDQQASEAKERENKKPAANLEKDIADLRERVLFIDDDVIALNKPPGLAVQGGTGITKSVDAMLGGLMFDKDQRPKLVHRLDKDTSGVLLLARSSQAAAKLAGAFRAKTARKVYWAVVVGAPNPLSGRINLALAKLPGNRGEMMVADEEKGKRAVTFYRTIEKAGRKACWLSLEPQTGRTHQLRVHMQALGTPILGDGKYGGQDAFLQGPGLSRKMHLHARAIRIPHPGGGEIEVIAPMPGHMEATWDFLGFDADLAVDPFALPDGEDYPTY